MERFLSFVIITLIAVVGTFAQSEKKPEKITVEELVAKHLASIGTPEAIAAAKSRVMAGVGVFTTKSSPGRIGGPAQLASSGDKFLLAIVLNSNDYPYEKFAYDGKDLTTGVRPGGGLSALGDFLRSNKVIFKRGLLGGVLSQQWAPLNAQKDVKLTFGGSTKMGDKSLYKVKASGAGLGDMTVSLYFEPDTFRHVRTEYFYRTGQLSTLSPDRTGGPAPSTYTLTEDFSNFTKVDDLILPMNYVLEYTTDVGRPMTWTVNFSQVFNNQPLEATVFRVS